MLAEYLHYFTLPTALLIEHIETATKTWLDAKENIIHELHHGLMADDTKIINELKHELKNGHNTASRLIDDWLEKLDTENRSVEYVTWALFLLTIDFSSSISSRALELLEDIQTKNENDEIEASLLKPTHFYALAKHANSGYRSNTETEKKKMFYLSQIAGIPIPDDEDPLLFMAKALGHAQQKVHALSGLGTQQTITLPEQKEPISPRLQQSVMMFKSQNIEHLDKSKPFVDDKPRKTFG